MWHVATIVNGTGINGLRTGDRVVFRIVAGVGVQVIAHGGLTAVVTLACAKRTLETLRTRDWKPVPAVGQAKLDIRWDRTREARRFGIAGTYPRAA